jgi:hypothetical protein
MKNFLLACCISLTALAPARAQVSKLDFENQITLLKQAFGPQMPSTIMQAEIRNKLTTMMGQQIDYINSKFNDKTLNYQCDEEKRQKAKVMGSCNLLQNYYNTLSTEKNCRDWLKGVPDNQLAIQQASVIQQLRTFSGTLQ